MMNALLVLSLLCQDADLSVSGKAGRHDKDFELTVSGKGRALQDLEFVHLRFRALANRLHWADGAIVTEAADEDVGRVAKVEHQAFTHVEAFAAAGEVEVRIRLGAADGGPSDATQIHRVFRTATLPETAHAIGADADAFDAALRGVRRMLEDVDALKNEPAPPMKRQGRLQKRVDWRRNAYRQALASSSLGASARALSQWMDDMDGAVELERTGKDPSGMISTLTGKPFAWDEARTQLSAIEAASLRERALLIVREVQAVAREIGAAVSIGDEKSWNRKDKEFTRTLEQLRQNDGKVRGGAAGGRYAALVDLGSGSVDDLIVEAIAYLQAAAGCLRCTGATGDVEELGRKLLDRASAFEVKIRTQS